jgi:hypothetical protein
MLGPSVIKDWLCSMAPFSLSYFAARGSESRLAVFQVLVCGRLGICSAYKRTQHGNMFETLDTSKRGPACLPDSVDEEHKLNSSDSPQQGETLRSVHTQNLHHVSSYRDLASYDGCSEDKSSMVPTIDQSCHIALEKA